MDAVTLLKDGNYGPEPALNEAVQNWLEEREYLPGYAAANAKYPEDERFGLDPDDDESDPSALTEQQREGGDPTSPTTRGAGGNGASARAANDKRPGEA
jgi:uncharacterized protein